MMRGSIGRIRLQCISPQAKKLHRFLGQQRVELMAFEFNFPDKYATLVFCVCFITCVLSVTNRNQAGDL